MFERLPHIECLPAIPHIHHRRSGEWSVSTLLCVLCLLLLLLICLELFAHTLTQSVNTEPQHHLLLVDFPHLFEDVLTKLRWGTAIDGGVDLPIDALQVVVLHLSVLPHRVGACRFTPGLLLRQHHF